MQLDRQRVGVVGFADSKAAAARGIVKAVSYTHLDVYKRQLVICRLSTGPVQVLIQMM